MDEIEYQMKIKELEQTIEKLKSENGWISVDDRLPKTNCEILVSSLNSKALFIAEYYECRFYVQDYGEMAITHWQPLPEPPKENI